MSEEEFQEFMAGLKIDEPYRTQDGDWCVALRAKRFQGEVIGISLDHAKKAAQMLAERLRAL